MPDDADSCAQLSGHEATRATRTRIPSLLPNIAAPPLFGTLYVRYARRSNQFRIRAGVLLCEMRRAASAPEKACCARPRARYNNRPFRSPIQAAHRRERNGLLL